MLRAEKVLAAGTWTGAPADSVVLEFDERYRRRFVMTGVGGLAFLLDLPEAAMLRGGDALRLEDGRVVEVLAAAEPLAEIRAADPLALMRVAWHLGNRHLPTEMTPKALRIRRDPVIEDMARGLGARVTPVEAPFNPEGGAYVQAEAPHAHSAGQARHGGHAHGHPAHGHAHEHDHADGHDQHGHGRGHGHSHDHARHENGHGHEHCDHPDHDHEHDHGHGHRR
jgi:urease accessory protein